MKRGRNLASRIIGIKELPVIVLIAVMCVYFARQAPNFADIQGILDDAKQYVPCTLLAIGLTLVIGSAGIDISVGSVLGLSTVVLGVTLSRTDIGLPLACVLALATGTGVGAFNGFAVARMKLQPVVVTLSTMAAARGFAYIVAGQGVSSIQLPPRAETLASAYNSPAPLMLAFVVAAAGALILSKCTLGRSILAIGSNEEAARFSGIDVGRVKIAVYTLTGALAGAAGIVTAGWINTASTDAGMGYEFEAITAVMIGGTSISGGEATVMGSVFGVIAAAVLMRGFGLMGIGDHWRMLCLGVILIVSVLLDRIRKYAARRSAVEVAA